MLKKNLIGKIIFANLLELPLYKYFNFIKKIEDNPILKDWLKQGLVQKENLSVIKPILHIPEKKHQLIGKYIKKNNNEYSIMYYNLYFQFYYKIDNSLWPRFENQTDKKQLLFLLRRVNSRNIITNSVLETIAKEQEDYFNSGDKLKIKNLTQTELAKKINQITKFYIDSNICHSWLSRLIPTLIIEISNGSKIPLKNLMPSLRDKIKWAMQKILNNENHLLIEGLIQNPYNDLKLREILTNKFKIITSRRNIASIRSELGICSARSRSKDIWHKLIPNFSHYFFLLKMKFLIKFRKFPEYMRYLYSKEKSITQKGLAQFFTLGVQRI